jgi:hypothetical protein
MTLTNDSLSKSLFKSSASIKIDIFKIKKKVLYLYISFKKNLNNKNINTYGGKIKTKKTKKSKVKRSTKKLKKSKIKNTKKYGIKKSALRIRMKTKKDIRK